MENTGIITYGMSDQAIREMVGGFIKHIRLQQNKTQQQVADSAGINRNTLVQMEKGEGGTISSLISILRTLQQLHVLSAFEVQQQISPMLLAREEQARRKRARNKGGGKKQQSTW